MSEVKFTKGKWSAHDKRPQCNGFSIFAENQYVAFVGDSDDNTDCKANANLIAAAPEMYEENENQIKFLRKFIQTFPVNSLEAMEVSDRIDAIFSIQAKARGE